MVLSFYVIPTARPDSFCFPIFVRHILKLAFVVFDHVGDLPLLADKQRHPPHILSVTTAAI